MKSTACAQACNIVKGVKLSTPRVLARDSFSQCRQSTGDGTVARAMGPANRSFAGLLTFAALVPPCLPERFWLPPDCSLPPRTRCVHHVYHLGFSSAGESRAGRPKSSPLPETQSQQIPLQAGRAHPRDRHSCAG